MDKKTVFIKTTMGEREAANLSSDLKRILSLIDNKSTVFELSKRAPPSMRESWMDMLGELEESGYIRDKNRQVVEPKIAVPKITPPKMFVPKPVKELDFNFLNAGLAPNTDELADKQRAEEQADKQREKEQAAAKHKAEEAAQARAELEAAFAAAKVRTSAEAASKAAAKVRQEAEFTARARAMVETDAAAKAEAKAIKDAEIAARARAAAEAKTKQESAARMQAARAKATQEVATRAKVEAEARVRAEIETAARAKQVAETKAKREAEAAARLQAEQEAARINTELQAAAKANAEAEAALQKAKEEAARVKVELEAAKARAEAEAKELARQLAEENARQEAEAARLKAQQELARIKAEQEASARERAQEQARQAAAQESVIHENKPEFEIKLDGFLGGTEQVNQTVVPVVDHAMQEMVEAAKKAGQEAEQLALDKTKAGAEMNSTNNIAAEMARLKQEAEVARRKIEENARRQAEEQALAEEQSKAWAEAEQRSKAQAIHEVTQATQQAALSQAKEAKKPVARARRKPLPLAKIAFGLSLSALVVALALPYVYPLEEYIPPLEQRLSAQLKQPVHIGGMSATSLPPRLLLRNVTLGNAQEVKAASAVLSFDLLALLAEIKVISNVDLQDVSIDGRLLDKQAASLKLLGGDAQFPVRHMTLQGVKIVTDEVALPSLNGIADIDAHGAFSRLSLHSADDKLGIELQSDQGRWQLGVNLKETSLPLLPGVVFSDLSAKGDLGDGEVNFTEMDGHIYNGILLGSAKLNWRKGWQLQGHLEAKMVELKKMFPKDGVDGEMSGEGTFALTGDRISQMGDAPRLEGSFAVKNGIVNGFDMVETARLLSRENLNGGRTRFDDMIGMVQLDNHTTHFRQLRIVSSMLSANGSFDVSPDNQLSGNFNVGIKMRAGNNQLSLYGVRPEQKLRAGR
jgi:hypothetical protein